MCILNVVNLYCSCPFRDRPRCPHHLYIRSTARTPTLPTTAEPTGFYLRRAGDFQRCIRWEPIPANRVWDHCPTFIRDRLTDPTTCPETLAAGHRYVRTTQRRDRCEQCVNGHPAPAPGLSRSNAVRRDRGSGQPNVGDISPDHPYYQFVLWVRQENLGPRPRGPNEPNMNDTSSGHIYYMYMLWVRQGNAPGPRPSEPDVAGERLADRDPLDLDISELEAILGLDDSDLDGSHLDSILSDLDYFSD